MSYAHQHRLSSKPGDGVGFNMRERGQTLAQPPHSGWFKHRPSKSLSRRASGRKQPRAGLATIIRTISRGTATISRQTGPSPVSVRTNAWALVRPVGQPRAGLVAQRPGNDASGIASIVEAQVLCVPDPALSGSHQDRTGRQ
jgi:hypothetical protein